MPAVPQLLRVVYMNKVGSMMVATALTKVTARRMINEGILLEVNRQFFHPLGLVLGLTAEMDKSDWDEPARLCLSATDDPEGFIYGSSRERMNKAQRFAAFAESKVAQRLAALGYVEQPLSEIFEGPES